MTRARDRLYLSSSLKDGVLVAGRGSLADVLPQSIGPSSGAPRRHVGGCRCSGLARRFRDQLRVAAVRAAHGCERREWSAAEPCRRA